MFVQSQDGKSEMTGKRIDVRKRLQAVPPEIVNAPLINWVMRENKKLPSDPNGNPMSGLNTDPRTVDFEAAVQSVVEGRTSGIGLPLLTCELSVLDLDDCVTGGQPDTWAEQILLECDSYAEFSPSGRGIHIYLLGKPKCGNHTQIAAGNGHMDVFVEKGFVTLTGRPVSGYGRRPIAPGADVAERIYRRLETSSKTIKKIRKHPKLLPLWLGDVGSYESASEADLAFLAMVAHLTRGDWELTESLWLQSGLNRPKLKRDDYRRRTLSKVFGETGNESLASISARDLVYPISEFMDLDLPPVEWLIDGFMTTGSLNMVFGVGGVGKSHFLVSLMKALDQGEAFMYWEVQRVCRVLYIDTEMPETKIQQRLRHWFGDVRLTESFLVSGAHFRRTLGSSFALDDVAHQDLLRGVITELDVEVVIIDPIAPALGRSDENSNNDVANYMPFLLELRDMGVTIILSHHSGKSDESGQRGASRRRDYLDLNVKLASKVEPGDRTAVFEVSFDKVRDEKPEPPTWIAELAMNDCHFWKLETRGPEDDPVFMAVLEYLYDHPDDRKVNVSTMAKALGLVRERLYDTYFRPARDHGYMRPRPAGGDPRGVGLTDKGAELVELHRRPSQ